MSWPLVKLSDVATINPRPPRDVDESQQVTFVAMASASEDGYLRASETCILSETKKGFTYFDRNDVLLAKITPCFENGKCLRPGQIHTEIGFGSTEFHVFRPDSERLDGLYLFYLVWNEQFRFLGEKSMSGAAGQKRVGSDFLKGFEIPLPPLPEQKRIAALLDKADAIRRKRQQAIQLADDFLRAVFLDMFGDVIEGVENVVRFSDVAVLDAPMVDPRVDEYIDLIHIGPDRIEKKIGKLLPALTAREEGLISKKFLFDDRYVLYSKIRPYLRKCAIAEGVGLCSADMYPVRPVEGVATKEFLWMLLLSDYFTAYTESLPARANIPKLNREELEAFTLSLPDYSQQLKFSSIVRTTNIASQRVVESAAYVDGAFESLSQKAFSGQL